MNTSIKVLALLFLVGMTVSLSLKSAATHEGTFSFLKGTQLTFVRDIKTVTINYSYWGSKKTADYNLRVYRSAGLGNAQVNVFVHTVFSQENEITIDDTFQYGVDNGVLFLVRHRDPQRGHGIYQRRFTEASGDLSTIKKAAVTAGSTINNFLQSKGVSFDITAFFGDALRNF